MSTSRKEQLEILRKMTDEELDYSDAPPLSDRDLSQMVLFVPPEKRTATIRLDADVLENKESLASHADTHGISSSDLGKLSIRNLFYSGLN